MSASSSPCRSPYRRLLSWTGKYGGLEKQQTGTPKQDDQPETGIEPHRNGAVPPASDSVRIL
jgi:hypothetical protein